MSEKLKPCPFCGGKAERAWQPSIFATESNFFSLVVCTECKAATGPCENDSAAARAWNSRAESQEGRVVSATKEQLEYNARLLEIIRNCGLFKCTDCLYALWEDQGYGLEYKCCAPHTVLHSAWNDLDHAMRGSACFAFEPSGEAKHHLVERMVKTQEAVAAFKDYAWRHTERSVMCDTADERRLSGICKTINEQGMVRA